MPLRFAFALLSLLLLPLVTYAQAGSSPAEQSQSVVRLDRSPTISLTPAIVMEKGKFAQSFTERITLMNDTAGEYAFEMIAQDAVTRDGKRVFVNAGELPGSIARTAVFTPTSGLIPPRSSFTVDVRVTVPPATDVRAVVVIFRNTQKLALGKGSVGMTGSLGALITFNITDAVKVAAAAPTVALDDTGAGVAVDQLLTNSGKEPVIPTGVAAILDGTGKLVAKVPFQPQRLLPGEKITFHADYAGQLRPATYRVLCSFDVAGEQVISNGSLRVE